MNLSRGKVAGASVRTLFVYSTVIAIYLMVNSITHPETMAKPLTHVLPWPTEGSALVFALLCSGSSFFLLRLWHMCRNPSQRVDHD